MKDGKGHVKVVRKLKKIRRSINLHSFGYSYRVRLSDLRIFVNYLPINAVHSTVVENITIAVSAFLAYFTHRRDNFSNYRPKQYSKHYHQSHRSLAQL